MKTIIKSLFIGLLLSASVSIVLSGCASKQYVKKFDEAD